MEITSYHEGETWTQHEIRRLVKKANIYAEYFTGKSIKSNRANLWALLVDPEAKIEKANIQKNWEVTLREW